MEDVDEPLHLANVLTVLIGRSRKITRSDHVPKDISFLVHFRFGIDLTRGKESIRPPAVSRCTRFHADFTISCHQGGPYQTNYHKIPVEIITK
jgi:hypothetical protein